MKRSGLLEKNSLMTEYENLPHFIDRHRCLFQPHRRAMRRGFGQPSVHQCADRQQGRHPRTYESVGAVRASIRGGAVTQNPADFSPENR
jgi:hypothetical protein